MNRRVFAEVDEKEARKFARKVNGIIKFTQSMDEDGNISLVYLVEWVER